MAAPAELVAVVGGLMVAPAELVLQDGKARFASYLVSVSDPGSVVDDVASLSLFGDISPSGSWTSPASSWSDESTVCGNSAMVLDVSSSARRDPARLYSELIRLETKSVRGGIGGGSRRSCLGSTVPVGGRKLSPSGPDI